MRIQVTARHFDSDPRLLEHIHGKIERLERFYDGITSVDVVLTETGGQPESGAEIKVNVRRHLLTGKATGTTHVEAFDRGFQRVRRRIQRYKARLRNTSQDRHR